MSDALIQRQAVNLDRLERSDLLNNWIDSHPNGWDHQGWLDLVEQVDRAGFMPVALDELGKTIQHLHTQRFTPTPRRVVRSAASVDQAQTMQGLGTAVWTHPLDFAERRVYEPGDFWLGRCPMRGTELGFHDNTHVWVNAGTGGGKGATVVLPNLLLWQGSIVSIDPKGTNANVAAARRGDGNDVCIGMGQEVAVLDPMGCCSGVEDKYLKSFNVLDALDPDEDKFQEKAAALAEAIVIRSESEKEPFFNDTSQALIEGIILHVKTAPEFGEEQYPWGRSMVTVYQLAKGGDKPGAKFFDRLNREAYEEELAQWEEGGRAGDAPKPPRPSDPFDVLFRMMKKNHACEEAIPDIADEMMDLRRGNDRKTWGNVRSSVARHMGFMKSKGLKKSLATTSEGFSLSRLKNDPKGMSLFLSLKLDDMTTYNRWLRMLVTMIIYELRADHQPMARGHRLLMCLDEFATLGYLEQIEEGFSTLREYDVKMMIVTQFIQQVQKHYGESWHGFLSNSRLRMFFGLDEKSAKEVSEWIGDAEYRDANTTVSLNANEQSGSAVAAGRNQSHGGSQATTGTETQGLTNTAGKNDSVAAGQNENSTFGQQSTETHGKSDGLAMTDGDSDSYARSGSRMKGANRGFSENTHSGRGISFPAEGIFGGLGLMTTTFGLPVDGATINHNEGQGRGTNEGISASATRGWSRTHTKNHSKTVNSSTQRSLAVGSSQSKSSGSSLVHTQATSSSQALSRSQALARTATEQWNEGSSLTLTKNKNKGHGVNVGLNETVQKRPLIYPHDLRLWFGELEEGDVHYPGLSLVLIQNEHPVIVQRTLYYDDLGFDGLFDRHPRYPQTDPEPLVRRRPFGFDLPSKGHLWDEGEPTFVRWCKQEGDTVQKNEVVLTVMPGPTAAWDELVDTRLTVRAPSSGTLIEQSVKEGQALVSDGVCGLIESNLGTDHRQAGIAVADELGAYNAGTHPEYKKFVAAKRKFDAKEAWQRTQAKLEAHEKEEAEKTRRGAVWWASVQIKNSLNWVPATTVLAGLVFIPVSFIAIGSPLEHFFGSGDEVFPIFLAFWMPTVLAFAGLMFLLNRCRKRGLEALFRNRITQIDNKPFQDDLGTRRENFFADEDKYTAPASVFGITTGVLAFGLLCITSAMKPWHYYPIGLLMALVLGFVLGVLLLIPIMWVRRVYWFTKEGEWIDPKGNVSSYPRQDWPLD